MKIKLITNFTIRDDALTATHPCIVKIKWCHNHEFETVENLGTLKINETTKNIFNEYFKTMTAAQAFKHHQKKRDELDEKGK